MTAHIPAGNVLAIGCKPDTLPAISQGLDDNGFRLAAAGDIEEGLQQAGALPPDLILLDAEMLQANAFATCRRLKAMERARDIPVLFLLPPGMTRRKEAVFAAGGTDYLVKPLRIEELMARAGTHARLRALQRDMAEKEEQLREFRKNLEESDARHHAGLLESERRCHEIFDSVSDFFYMLDVLGNGRFRIAEINRGVEKLMQMPRTDILGKYVEEVIPRAVEQGVIDRLQRCASTGRVLEEEIELDLPAGRHDFQATYFPILENGSGRVYRVVSLARDTTMRKQHDAVRQRRDELESMLRKIVEVAPGSLGIYRMTPDGKTSMPYWSPQMEEIAGFDREEVQRDASSADKHIHPDDVAAHLASIQESARTLSPWHNEFRVRHPKKGEIWLEGRSIPERAADGSIVWYGFLHDVTLRKQHEAMRQERDNLESLVKQIVSVAPGALFMYRLGTDGKRSMPYATSKMEEITGLSVEQMRQDASTDLQHVHPEDIGGHIASIQESARTLKPWHNEFRVFHPTKGEVWIEGRAIPERAPDGATVWYGFLHDVTERKRAEELLHASEAKFRALADSLPDIVMCYDKDCRRDYVNQRFLKFIGLSKEQALETIPGENWRCSITPDDYTAILRRVMERGKSDRGFMSWHMNNGKVLHCHYYALPKRDKDGNVIGALFIGRDITALKEAEMRLEESRARLRELAAHRDTAREEERKHIARELHDELGQFLSALRIQASMLRMQFGKDNLPLAEHVNGMIQMIDRNIQMVRNIASSLRPAVLDLGVASALEWLVNEFVEYSGIRCDLHVAKQEVGMSDHCATTLFRIVQESLTNVTRHADARHVQITLCRKDARYQLKVRDDGKGFDPAKVRKKTLGLIGMHERVLMLGGELHITSSPGHGTLLEASIPINDDT